MARQPHPQREFSYQNVEIFRNEENTLGIGSYGAVYRAKCDELPCAAKCLHPVFFQYNDPGMLDAIGKFEQECHFLSTVRHPNIIQYLGVIQDPDSGRPVLLMELMDESLTRFLERQNGTLPYHVQVSLAYDITLALAYLHFNGMVHRDLSSNNVLLIAGSRAKVTDFGMSKLIDVNPRMTPLTQCPGTLVYMPPEALLSRPRYTGKLDCFSDGVLMVQIMTQKFPEPGPNMREIEDSRSPTGVIHIPVSEVERRRNHIEQIDPTQPLLAIALDCLKDKENERPSARELCHRIAALKEAIQYAESVQQASERGQSAATEGEGQDREVIEQLERQAQDLQELLHHRDEQLQEKDIGIRHREEQILRQNQQLQEKDTTIAAGQRESQGLRQQLHTTRATNQRQIQDLQQQLQSRDDQLQASNAAVLEKNNVIEDRERRLRELNQQLQVNEQVTAEFQQNLLQKERMVRDLEERLTAKDRENRVLQQRQSSRRADGESIQLTWRESERAPCKMSRGAAITEGKVAYFKPFLSEEVHTYNSEKEEWSQLPVCPHSNFGLAVVKGMVTAVGGYDSAVEDTNILLSLTGQGRDRKWVKHFPPMPTKRYSTATAYDGRNLIVAGGFADYEQVSTVEVMDTENLHWYTAASLPHPLSRTTITICVDTVYLLGGRDHKDKDTKSVFTCSLTALLQSCQPQPLKARLQRTQRLKVWHTIANIPRYSSTCTTLRGELVAVGGYKSDINKKTTAVHQYSPSTNSWQVISRMTTARDDCLVAVFQHNKLVVVGGYTHGKVQTDVVEIATVS